MSPLLWLDKLSAFAPPFIDAAFRGAVVLLLALLLTYAMRRRTAAARHLVWVGAIVVQLLLPLFAIWGPRWELAVPAAVASVSPIAIPASTPEPRAPSATTAERAGPSLRSGRQAESAPSSAPVRVDAVQVSGRTILALWILGAVIILVRLAIGTTMVARLARKGARVDDGSWLSLAQRLSAALQIDRPLTLLIKAAYWLGM